MVVVNGNSFWKTVALVCVSVLVAGAPGIVYALRTWSVNTDVQIIRERQDDVRIRLRVLETQNANLIITVDQLRVELARHEQETK